jgi:RNA polymerase sigma factor (sigma-70 family)
MARHCRRTRNGCARETGSAPKTWYRRHCCAPGGIRRRWTPPRARCAPGCSRPPAIDAWRRRSARVAEVVTDQLPEPIPDFDEADRAVEAWTVADALNRLTPAHREVLMACFYQGHSVAEAAARLGIPSGTVKSRTHYALRALRVALEEAGVIA